jgi:hypothetical protein
MTVKVMMQSIDGHEHVQIDGMKDGGETFLPPWRENRSRLISLWEMLQFAADSFARLTMCLRGAFVSLEGSEKDTVSANAAQTIAEWNEELRGHLEVLGLRMSVDTAQRISLLIELTPEPDRKLLRQFIEDLVTRVEDELKSVRFFVVPPNKHHFYEQKQPLFGQQVWENFPSAISDIEEAGKCLALDRATACVCHLMRVMEVGLKALAHALGIPYAPSWEAYIDQIQKRIGTKYKKKGIQWRRDEPFFRDVLGDLLSVKLAWRNPTMYIVRKYTPDESEDVFRAVRGLMIRLAMRLSEHSPKKRQRSRKNS